MSKHYGSFVGTPIEFDGSPNPDRKNSSVGLFGEMARWVWPRKTAFHLAELGDVSDRAARDWMSGKAAPPDFVAAVVFAEVLRLNRSR